MKIQWNRTFMMALIVALTTSVSSAQSVNNALTRADFTRADTVDKIPSLPPDGYPHGFGDRQNGWAWGMEWFNGKLYVGTARAYACMVSASINRVIPLLAPYPPPDPDVSCTPNPHDLPLQAEIWAWDPATDTWSRMYQSPADLVIPGTEAAPKYVARDVGFRGMHIHQEPDGAGGTVDVLYVSGVSASWIWPGLPGGRILRSTDGVTFTPLPQTPGTFLGDLNNSSMRGMETIGTKLFVIAGGIMGSGRLIEADEPWLGNDAFRDVPIPNNVMEIEEYNGTIYLGMVGPSNEGFQIGKLSGPTPPYSVTTIITKGGHRAPYPNHEIISMKVFNGRLYAGGNGMRSYFSSDIVRVTAGATPADPDTWDVIIGPARLVPFGSSGCTDPAGCLKQPLSGLPAGFGWPLNAHIWRMEIFDGRLYLGTFDMSTTWLKMPTLGAAVKPAMGFDLTMTEDGEHFSMVDFRGFRAGPIDANPMTSTDGNIWNFGARTMKTTPYGLFLGTANYYYGIQIWRGVPTPITPTTLLAPSKLMAEQVETTTLLAWERPAGATKFHVYRSKRLTADPTGGMLTEAGADLDTTFASSFDEVGVVTTPYFADTTSGGQSYTYFVIAENAAGLRSQLSNLVSNSARPFPVTFLGIGKAIAMIGERRGLPASAFATLNLSLAQAAIAARAGDPRGLAALLRAVEIGTFTKPTMLDQAGETQIASLLNRLLKRANLARGGLLAPTAL